MGPGRGQETPWFPTVVTVIINTQRFLEHLLWARQLYQHYHLISIATVGFIIISILQIRKLRFERVEGHSLARPQGASVPLVPCKWHLLERSAVALGSMRPASQNW